MMTSIDSNDSQPLVTRLGRGEATALGEAYDEHGPATYAVALRVVGQAGEAEEVVQDTFRALWDHAAELAERGVNLRAWLITAARRRAIDVLRKRRSRITPATELNQVQAAGAAEHATVEPLARDTILAKEQTAEICDAVEKLPSEQAEVVRLAFGADLSQQEIAQRLGLPLGTIKSRMRYALIKLRGLVKEGGHD